MKQLNADSRICVLDKASTIGAHSISGAVLEPSPLDRLLPQWRSVYRGMSVPASEDRFRILTRSTSTLDWLFRLVPKLLPKSMTHSTPFNNEGNLIVSLGELTAFLAEQAESSGVDVFAGFAATEALFANDGSVEGVRVGDMGVDKDGARGENFTAGVDVHAKLTVLAEGTRSSISKQLIQSFKPAEGQ
jgi:electron-transferring-flavoprotein dehydrogenase